MKVYINLDLLVHSPVGYSEHYFEDSEIRQLRETLTKEILYANPSSFLISGYRGVGKTSFVQRLLHELPNNYAVVHLNISKYNGYPDLLKKVIRQIYIQYTKKVEAREVEKTEIADVIELLFDRTFKDVTFYGAESTSKKWREVFKTSFPLKTVLPALFTILGTINSIWFNFTFKPLGITLLLCSIAWLILASFEIEWKSEKDIHKSSGSSWKSLYDDEIADYHLTDLLLRLKEVNIPVIICLDELDKLKDEGEIELLINDLKPMFLTGFANFIVIAGQSMVYQLEKSKFLDDQVISSLFAKDINIPLPRYETMRDFGLRLFEDTKMAKDRRVIHYMNSLVLKSGLVPRKLINIIRKDIQWDEEKAFVEIDEDDLDRHEWDSKLLTILSAIIDSELPQMTGDQIEHNLLSSYIHIWISKMLVYKRINRSFYEEDFFDPKDEDMKFYPTHYLGSLRGVSRLLIDRLIGQQLLKSESVSDNLGQQIKDSYWWQVKEDIGNTVEQQLDLNNEIKQSSADAKLPEINDLSKRIKNIEDIITRFEMEMLSDQTLVMSSSLIDRLNNLVRIGVLDHNWFDSEILQEALALRNASGHNELNDELLVSFGDVTFNLSRLEAELVQKLIASAIQALLPDFKDGSKRFADQVKRFDYLATRSKDATVVGFEIKYYRKSPFRQNEFSDAANRFFKVFSDTNTKTAFGFLVVTDRELKPSLLHRVLIANKLADSPNIFGTNSRFILVSLADGTRIQDQIKVDIDWLKQSLDPD